MTRDLDVGGGLTSHNKVLIEKIKSPVDRISSIGFQAKFGPNLPGEARAYPNFRVIECGSIQILPAAVISKMVSHIVSSKFEAGTQEGFEFVV